MKSLGSMHYIWLRSWANPTCSCRIWRGEQNKTMFSKASISPGVLRVQRFEVYTRGYNIPSTLKLEKTGFVSVRLSSKPSNDYVSRASNLNNIEMSTQVKSRRGAIVCDHHQHIEQRYIGSDHFPKQPWSNDWTTEPPSPFLYPDLKLVPLSQFCFAMSRNNTKVTVSEPELLNTGGNRGKSGRGKDEMKKASPDLCQLMGTISSIN